MDAALDNALRLLQLAFPALLGAVAGATRLFDDPRRAIRALNGYALTFGFPALVLRGLLQTGELPGDPAFWLIWPVSLLVLLVGIRLIAPRDQRGTLALVTAFGNVAYLGLPFVLALYGLEVAGDAALAVSIHVTLAVTVGPMLLESWGRAGAANWRAALGRAARLPLFWAPVIGLLVRTLPAGGRTATLDWITPIAQSAAPVALFVIGLHVFVERRHLAHVSGPLVAHLSVCLLITPALVTGLALAAVHAGWLTPSLGRVHVILASMPAAVTTFAIAERSGIGRERVAAVVVWSSALALILLPIWSWVAGAVL